MFALTGGELAMVLFLFALVWGAGLLPRLAERLGAWLPRREREATQARAPRDGA
jgi:Sec-independent protein translocase protein TatA